MRQGLIYREPVLLEEVERQLLIWSRWVRDAEGRQLGESTHIDWTSWDSSPAFSLIQWTMSRCLDAHTFAQQYGIHRGVATRIFEIKDAIPEEWAHILQSQHSGSPSLDDGWWGYFE